MADANVLDAMGPLFLLPGMGHLCLVNGVLSNLLSGERVQVEGRLLI